MLAYRHTDTFIAIVRTSYQARSNKLGWDVSRIVLVIKIITTTMFMVLSS